MIFLKLVLHVNHWNWIVHACVWGSYLIYLLLSAFISTIYLKAPFFSAQYFILCTPAALPPSPRHPRPTRGSGGSNAQISSSCCRRRTRGLPLASWLAYFPISWPSCTPLASSCPLVA